MSSGPLFVKYARMPLVCNYGIIFHGVRRTKAAFNGCHLGTESRDNPLSGAFVVLLSMVTSRSALGVTGNVP